MPNRIVVDPVTRIEGHLRVEAIMGGDGKVQDALSSGTMWRGVETILQGRDPREAWALTQRICGVCTTVHGLTSVRAVENALGIRVPQNADIIRNMLFLTQMVQDHVIHFYHLHALDWVDVVSALSADPAATSNLQKSISTWPNNTPEYFSGVRNTLQNFVNSGQLGIFQNAYWGHPAYKLPPEGNLLAVAHYLEALNWQKEIVKIHALFGGKNPHPNYLVGGIACPITPSGGKGLTLAKLNSIRPLITQAIDVVEKLYYPDLMLLARFYPEWANYGAGLGNYMAYGDIPQNGVDDPSRFRFPRGVLLRGQSGVFPLDPLDPGQIGEEVAHSWFTYPRGSASLHPYDGVTTPAYSGPKPPYNYLDENGKYSWLKAPRWKGNAVEVGPLARVLVGYASGRTEFQTVVNEAAGRLGIGLDKLSSTLGRTLARCLETRLAANWLLAEYNNLMANVGRGIVDTADTSRWDPATWPASAKGFGFTEAPRGALGHWISINGGKIERYQAVVASTWNASPRDGAGQRGAYEAALVGTPVADSAKPLEILRTIHSFDPCLACATHVISPEGRRLADVVVR